MAAIGIVSGLLLVVTHEVLGHSLMSIVLGDRVTYVSTIWTTWSGPASRATMRAISAAGIAANLIVGCLVLFVARSLPAKAGATRYFAWVFGHSTLFMGSGYLVVFAFLPIGDVQDVLRGLPFQLALQVSAVLVGATIYAAAVIDARRTFRRWIGEGRPRAFDLALVPYLAMGLSVTLASSFGEQRYVPALWAGAATFAASSGLLGSAVVNPRTWTRMPIERLDLPRNPAWIAGGLASALVLFFVLGPGIPR
jgi:hypothetical protein